LFTRQPPPNQNLWSVNTQAPAAVISCRLFGGSPAPSEANRSHSWNSTFCGRACKLTLATQLLNLPKISFPPSSTTQQLSQPRDETLISADAFQIPLLPLLPRRSFFDSMTPSSSSSSPLRSNTKIKAKHTQRRTYLEAKVPPGVIDQLIRNFELVCQCFD
jgi:hypothetical protein